MTTLDNPGTLRNFAFISRHTPTAEQVAMAETQGIILTHIGDHDAFKITVADVYEAGQFEGVVVVHPLAALTLQASFVVGIFENEMRAAEGERPTFHAKSFHLFDNLERYGF